MPTKKPFFYVVLLDDNSSYICLSEHKNMPLADAIGLIERDYDRYSRSSHITGRTPPRGTSSLGLGGSGLVRASESDDVSSLMTKAAAGGSLSSTELNALITTLQQKQRHTEIKGELHNAL